MRKDWIVALALVLAFSFTFAGTGLAKSDHDGKESPQTNAPSRGNGNGQHDDGGRGNGQGNGGNKDNDRRSGNEGGKNNEDNRGKPETRGGISVTGDTYGAPVKSVPFGLLNAFGHVQGKHASDVIEGKLRERYGITDLVYGLYLKGKGHGVTVYVYGVTGGVYGSVYASGGAGTVTGDVYGETLTREELLAYADALRDALRNLKQSAELADEALEQLAEIYEGEGALDQAIEAQQDAIKENISNLKHYNKLGKLFEKSGDHAIKGYVNGERVDFEVQPLIRNGSTLVPFRAISAALRATVDWNEAERTVTVAKNGVVIKLVIGSDIATINGEEVKLETAAAIVDGSTVVPVRFIGEAFDADVQWDEETKSFIVNES
ncbi:stalk domain-containing protein [Paenibacillus cymbidii]|uniref:stalk domain-containing protein n=1 Tax=Paenibacillus cymbidii TaxID=1639034 RepID=UPI001080D5B0|nr:stalk domain-containing protein [Paenibacillus cymbidii]